MILKRKQSNICGGTLMYECTRKLMSIIIIFMEPEIGITLNIYSNCIVYQTGRPIYLLPIDSCMLPGRLRTLTAIPYAFLQLSKIICIECQPQPYYELTVPRSAAIACAREC